MRRTMLMESTKRTTRQITRQTTRKRSTTRTTRKKSTTRTTKVRSTMMSTKMRSTLKRSTTRSHPFLRRLSLMPMDTRRSTHTTIGNQLSTQEHILPAQTPDMWSQFTECSTDMETHTVDTTLDTNNNTQEPSTDME